MRAKQPVLVMVGWQGSLICNSMSDPNIKFWASPAQMWREGDIQIRWAYTDTVLIAYKETGK